MIQPFTDQVERPTALKHQSLLVISNFETTELSTLSTRSTSGKTQKPKCAAWTIKTEFSEPCA
ncbi:hypothetical protein AAY52_00010 [Vibrio metoecus]|nr:hypothetical protein AAY52_00010 [Vibrio metoecus]